MSVDPVVCWTDWLKNVFYNERVRPPRGRGPHDGLDRRSRIPFVDQRLGRGQKALAPLWLLASNKDLARKLAALEVCQASRALMYLPPAKGGVVGFIANLEEQK